MHKCTHTHTHIHTHTHTHTHTPPLSLSPVDKSNLMVGSYGPKTDPHVYQTPLEDAPSGIISRGAYNIKSKFTDDDKTPIKEWEWVLNIKKDWA